MLRQQLSNHHFEKNAEKKIKLPNKNTLDEQKTHTIKSCLNDNLGKICNFSGDSISSSPPDGHFMHNLKMRMEKA